MQSCAVNDHAHTSFIWIIMFFDGGLQFWGYVGTDAEQSV
jgi:hypothetical protein